MTSFESASSWKQPLPPPASAQRAHLLGSIAREICELSPQRLRLAIDGFTAAGKTSFGHELAQEVRRLGRPTLRASLDDFKKSWKDAREKGYDRVSGDGYYRNPHDFEAARSLLLEPAGPDGSGQVILCARDPITGADHRGTIVDAPPDAVLVVDAVFAFRPEYNDFWDYRIWLDIESEIALRRGIERDTEMEGRGSRAAAPRSLSRGRADLHLRSRPEGARRHRGRQHRFCLAEHHPTPPDLLAEPPVHH